MEEATLALRAALQGLAPDVQLSADQCVRPVGGVEGAFLVKGVLSSTEREALLLAVRAVHDADPKARRGSAGGGDGGGAEAEAKGERDGAPSVRRRSSQHHTPCRMPPEALAPLCRRLRPCLPPIAGPKNRCRLEQPGREVSAFLRCYDYREGDESAPHFDRSYVENAAPAAAAAAAAAADPTSALSEEGHREEPNQRTTTEEGGVKKVNEEGEEEKPAEGEQQPQSQQQQGGGSVVPASRRRPVALRFSAYSLLLYLNDDFEGGTTTFFQQAAPLKRSKRGNTLSSAATATSADTAMTTTMGGDGGGLPSGPATTAPLPSPPAVTAGAKAEAAAPLPPDDRIVGAPPLPSEPSACQPLPPGCSGAVNVVPVAGDALVFPHGRRAGCFPDPFHSGAPVEAGRKTIIRTDLMFAEGKSKKR